MPVALRRHSAEFVEAPEVTFYPQPASLGGKDPKKVDCRERQVDPEQSFDDLHLDGMQNARNQRAPAEIVGLFSLALCHPPTE